MEMVFADTDSWLVSRVKPCISGLDLVSRNSLASMQNDGVYMYRGVVVLN